MDRPRNVRVRRLKNAIVVDCACGEAVPMLVSDVGPVECRGCGAEYNPRSGVQLPVCEGFEVPAALDAPQLGP